MEKYIAYINRKEEVAEAVNIYSPAWPDIDKYVEGIFYEGDIEEPEAREGYVSKRMVKLEGEGTPFIFYTYSPVPEPGETQMQKTQKQIAELETRTKVLEYTAQTTGETLDIHEGAIVDVMNLALGGSLREA